MTLSPSLLVLPSLKMILKTVIKRNLSLFTSQILALGQFLTKSVILLLFSQMLPTHLLHGRTTKLLSQADSTFKPVLPNSIPSTNGIETPQSLTASLLPWALLKYHKALVFSGTFKATIMWLLQLDPRSSHGSLQLDGSLTALTLHSPSWTSNALTLLAVPQLHQQIPLPTTSPTALLTLTVTSPIWLTKHSTKLLWIPLVLLVSGS